MFFLKMKYWLEMHKGTILFGLFAIIIILFVYSGISVDTSFIVDDPTLFGVIGTLIGALIGGTFSLLGSVWVNNRQQRSRQNIKRKNIIYSPLYDELVDIQNNILKYNPYPSYITFEKGPQTMAPHPQYDAWRRIKSDTRYLETPEYLKKQMDKLENTIKRYKNVRNKVDDEVQKIFNDVLIEKKLEPCSIVNIGTVISNSILKNEGEDIYSRAMFDDKNIDIEKKEEINRNMWKICNSNLLVIETRACYDDLLKVQEQTIEMLSVLIKRVLLKYEE